MKSEQLKDYKRKKKDLKIQFKEQKRQYKNNKKELKKEYNKLIEEIEKQKETNVNNPPKRSILEEIGNAVTHGVGSIFSIVAFLLMLFNSETNIEVISSVIYFVGLFILFTMSCLYHAFKHGLVVKRIFRRFDYSSIYLLIGATFVPLLLIFVGGTLGIIFCIIQWVIIITGITFVCVFGPHRLRALHLTLYLVLGWSGLIFIPLMFKKEILLFYYILGGGIIYSLGIIPFALKKKCSHFIWHFFVLGGAVVQWIGIYLSLYL